MSELILPSSNGVQSFEIRRMLKTLEQERQHQRGVHPQTQEQISIELDKLRALADTGSFRALVAVGLLRSSAELPKEIPHDMPVALAPMVKTLFSCPHTDRAMALDLARMTDAFLQHVMSHHFPPESAPPIA